MAHLGSRSESRDEMFEYITLRSPARLHFGLLEICPGEQNLYGGLGITIDGPATQISVETLKGKADGNSHWRIEEAGIWQDRMEFVLQKLQRDLFSIRTLAIDSEEKESPSIIRLDRPPEAHAGLGSGTQLACSVATAVASEYLRSQDERSTLTAANIWEHPIFANDRSAVRRLADATGRGSRSYVGLAGHLYGGLIVDRGISSESNSERVIERLAIPNTWYAVLVRPTASTTISGTLEIDYFAQCAVPNPNRQRMLSLIEEEIKPSIDLADIARFGDAIYQYGRLAGEIFRAAQGGIYRDENVASLIEAIRNLGVSATGQTSWGPTVYAIVESSIRAEKLQTELLAKYGSAVSSSVTRLTNEPAKITKSGGSR